MTVTIEGGGGGCGFFVKMKRRKAWGFAAMMMTARGDGEEDFEGL